MTTNFRIAWRNEDYCEVYLGQEHLFAVDYDTYGRAGQHGMLSAVRTIADRFSVEVEEDWPDYDEDE